MKPPLLSRYYDRKAPLLTRTKVIEPKGRPKGPPAARGTVGTLIDVGGASKPNKDSSCVLW